MNEHKDNSDVVGVINKLMSITLKTEKHKDWIKYYRRVIICLEAKRQPNNVLTMLDNREYRIGTRQ